MIIYIDLDRVVADFDSAILKIDPTALSNENSYDKVGQILRQNPRFFLNLPMIHGAKEAVIKLNQNHEIYFLSSPFWASPYSFIDKRLWVEKNFGSLAEKRLILTNRKDLCIGDILIDDSFNNGASDFTGFHIHFGSDRFPSWDKVLKYISKLESNN